MRSPIRNTLCTSACAGLLAATLVASGCGGGGGGGGSGSTSTVSGNISNQSTAMREKSRPTFLARVVRWLSPVTEAIAGRNGIHVSVNGTQVDTDQNGFFALTGPFSGAVTVSFGNGNRSFTVNIDVPAGATVILRDVDLREDGSAHPGDVDVHLRGTIVSASCGTSPQTVTIMPRGGGSNVTFDLNGDTKIKVDGQGGKTCSDLAAAAGQPASVEAVQQGDGSLLAERVKVRPTESDEQDEVEFRGLVTATSCPDSITVQRPDGQSVTVNLTSSTEIEDGQSCAGLAGQHVKVEGAAQPDGSVTATHIEVEDSGEIDHEADEDGGGQFGTPTPEPTETPESTPTPTP
jgi:hypothetical protein